jgi:hypothetical protein
LALSDSSRRFSVIWRRLFNVAATIVFAPGNQTVDASERLLQLAQHSAETRPIPRSGAGALRRQLRRALR